MAPCVPEFVLDYKIRTNAATDVALRAQYLPLALTTAWRVETFTLNDNGVEYSPFDSNRSLDYSISYSHLIAWTYRDALHLSHIVLFSLRAASI